MKSNYIDMVVAEAARVGIFALPAWSHAKVGDLIMADDVQWTVIASQTVSKDGTEHQFAVAMNGGKIRRAKTIFHAEALDWEEDEDKPPLEDEDGPAAE